MAGTDPVGEFDVRSNLRQVLADLKEFDPALARDLRRRLRGAGEDAIKAMGAILDEGGGQIVAGKTFGEGTDRLGRKRKHLLMSVETREASRSRSRGAREEIKAGLKLRVSTAKSGASIRLTTTKGDLRKAMNAKTWRHPVFGDRDVYVEQAGSQFFTRGTEGQRDNVRREVEAALREAVATLRAHNPNYDL